jgi:hypothetical protein
MYLDLNLHTRTYKELNVQVYVLISMTVWKNTTSSTTPFETTYWPLTVSWLREHLLASSHTCASVRSNGYCSRCPLLLLRPSSGLLVIGLFESVARAELGVVIQCSAQIGHDSASLIRVSDMSITEKLP